MKTIFCLALALIAVSTPGFAAATVTLGGCIFSTPYLSSDVTKLFDTPITLKRTPDACSQKLLADVIKATVIPSVVIQLGELSPSDSPEPVTITLTNVIIKNYSLLLDVQLVEQLELVPATMVITDGVLKTTTTCSWTSKTCS
jgi:hypothetical protein